MDARSGVPKKESHMFEYYLSGKGMKMYMDIPLEGVNRFVNGFVERIQGACRYPNEPTPMQNEPQ
jgi:hypothetical protein